MRSHVLPILVATASTGKAKQWQIRVDELPEGSAKVSTTWGLVGNKLQTKVEIIKEGKNIGRSNETTPWDQAVSEANSDYQAKLDKNYLPEGAEEAGEAPISRILLPMLAHDYRKRGHDIILPAYHQPKLNGIRALAEKYGDLEINITSRKGKQFPPGVADHLIPYLNVMMQVGEVFDGELYKHEWNFQEILRAVKKPREWAGQLEYHLFDIADPKLTFANRLHNLAHRFKYHDHPLDTGNIRLVPTEQLTTSEEIKLHHDIYVRDGYEGIIIRNANGLYVFDHRAKDLQKYKEFIDQEFVIVGAEYETITDPETHEELQAVVWVCIQEDGLNFKVRPKGMVADRVYLYQHREEYIGSQLTVRYQNRSIPDEKGQGGNIPIFPVGIAIRDYE